MYLYTVSTLSLVGVWDRLRRAYRFKIPLEPLPVLGVQSSPLAYFFLPSVLWRGLAECPTTKFLTSYTAATITF